MKSCKYLDAIMSHEYWEFILDLIFKLENKVSYDDYLIKTYKQSIVDELASLQDIKQKIDEFGDVFYKTELKSIKDLENDIYPL